MIEPAITAGAFLSQLVANFAGEAMTDTAADSATAEDFVQILSSQETLSEVLGRLRELLPEAAFAQVEALLAEGKGLPQAADVAAQVLSDMTLTQEDMAPLYAALGLVYPFAPEQSQTLGEKLLRPAFLLGGPTDRRGLPALSPGQESAASTDAAAPGRNRQTPLLQAAGKTDASAIVAGEVAASAFGPSLPQLTGSGSARIEATPTALAYMGALSGSSGPVTAESAAFPRPVLSAATDMDVPLGDAKWGRSLGDRLLLMIGRTQQSASIKITPPDMGAIDIKVSVKNDQVNVGFTAQHAVVKEAIEAAVPRLREMFGDNNLQLVNVDVGQRGDSDQRPMTDGSAGRNGEGQDGPSSAAGADAGGETGAAAGLHTYRSDSLLDDYA